MWKWRYSPRKDYSHSTLFTALVMNELCNLIAQTALTLDVAIVNLQ